MNNVELAGIVTEYKYSHKIKELDIYQGTLKVYRNSGIPDYIPFQYFKEDIKVGEPYSFKGELRTFRQEEYPKKRHYVKVLADKQLLEPIMDNHVKLSGVIRYKTPLRKTPLGKSITDFSIEIKDSGYTAYISTIAWGYCANIIDKFKDGDPITITGRIQSRIYKKQTGESHEIIEISTCKVL